MDIKFDNIKNDLVVEGFVISQMDFFLRNKT